MSDECLNAEKTSDNCLKMSEKMSDNCLKMSEKLSEKKYNCTKCNKQFNNRKTKWSHEQKCNDNTLKVENAKLKEKVEIFEKEIDTMKGQMLELMNKVCKIHPKTLTKINKQLNNTMINNTINNTYNIVQLGRENLSEIFSNKEKLDVLRKGYTILPYLVEYT